MNRATLLRAALLLDLIHSDQMTAEQAEHLLEDNPEFAAWYRQKPGRQENLGGTDGGRACQGARADRLI